MNNSVNKKRKSLIKNPKLKILIIALIIIIILTIVLIVIINTKKKNKTIVSTNNNEEFVVVSENGVKNNISSKVKETKKIENLNFSDITISMKNNSTVVSGKVSNPTNEAIKGFYFKIYALNGNDETIATTEGLLDSQIEAGETITFQSTTSKDFANCYDIRIEKIKDAD